MSRMGRPKSDNPKSTQITVRLNDSDLKILEDYYTQEKIERAEAVRHGIRRLKDDQKK